MKKACGLVHEPTAESLCPQAAAAYPVHNGALWDELNTLISTDAFKTKAIDWLAGAVQVPSESFDIMDPVGVDPRWEIFGSMHKYLADVFPLVHETLSLTKVNTYGLLYEWTGSDPSLKPLLLAAHQDVVPVHPNTVDEWTHPPFSGYFDGTHIWGRGSFDDKSGLIGILIIIESLLEKGFKPTRTVVLSFGFDEETSGLQGAAPLAKAMLETYGKDAFQMIVDEGSGFTEVYGIPFAIPGIVEKGYLDTKLEIAAPGGHSSVPPKSTSIGMLAALLTEIENNPFPLKLSKEDVLYNNLQCLAAHSKDVPKELRDAIEWSSYSSKGLRAIEKIIFKDQLYRSLVGTTQAIDLINGGVKTNALPEQAWAVVNHRISTLSSIDATIAHDTQTLTKLAKEFNLTYTSFGELILEGAPEKTLVLSDAFGNALKPAPRTPSSGEGAAPYELISGTIKATFNAHRGIVGDNNIAVSPGMMSGNTDTRYYWDLSSHIFRYNHHGMSADSAGGLSGGIHTVNENINVDCFLEVIRFFSTLILNTDEARF
ncbi:carboxypeptidase S [Hymenopellis radicata]|nr:carboxypeptidase S [Hymenopellis radicata]